MEDTIRVTVEYASTADASGRKTEVVEAVSLDVAANDAIENEDGDFFVVGVHMSEYVNDRSQR